jgi:DNA-binding response OmpR family regulator
MYRILLVDDDLTQLRIRELVLSSAGFLVCVAHNARSALESLKSMQGEIGLVITDHNLPERNGSELVRELRLAYPTLPVMVLSGMPGIEPQYEGLDVIIRLKPLPAPEFIKLVRDFLPRDGTQPGSELPR